MTQRDDGHDYRDSKNKAQAYERKKKYRYLQVHKLHYTLVDKDGNDNGKIYEYDGDHSLFCDGIDFNDLKEIKK